jgi:hypothetical protein
MNVSYVLIAATTLIFPSTFATAAGGAKTCSEAVSKCQVEGKKYPDIKERCAAAGAQCTNTGVFVGPYSKRKWTIPNRT